MSDSPTIGIIGGTGVGALPFEYSAHVKLDSALRAVPAVHGKFDIPEPHEILYIHRHTQGRVPPHQIDHKTNIRALAHCDYIIATTACGSLRSTLHPCEFAIPVDYIDDTDTHLTFIEDRIEHPSSNPAFDHDLQQCLVSAFFTAGLTPPQVGVGPKGLTLVSIRGPRFCTRAESVRHAHVSDLINMTTGPESSLCRELNIPYSPLAYITDYDSAALPIDETPDTSYEVIKERFKDASEKLQLILPAAASRISKMHHERA